MNKYLFQLIVVVAFAIAICGAFFIAKKNKEDRENFVQPIEKSIRTVELSVMEIDSCEYIVCGTYSTDGGVSIVHKQNCKYCLQRNSK